MGSIKSFLDWVKGGDAEDDYEEDMSRQPRSEEPAINSVPSSYENRSYDHSYSSATVENTVSQPRHESLRDNKVVSINTTSKLAVVLVKPDRFEQAAEIADHLKDKRTVVLNLEQTNKDIARPAAWIGFATFAKAPQACPPMPWKLISYVWIPVAS